MYLYMTHSELKLFALEFALLYIQREYRRVINYIDSYISVIWVVCIFDPVLLKRMSGLIFH